MAETITAAGLGPLATIADGGSGDPGLAGLDYRQFFSVDIDPGTGKVRRHFIFSTGLVRTTDFTSTGIFTDAPLGSVIFHVGTIRLADTTEPAGGFIAIRLVVSANTIADWLLASGTALSGLVTG